MNDGTSHESNGDPDPEFAPVDEFDAPVDAGLADLLASPSVWAEPPPELGDRVVEAITGEHSLHHITRAERRFDVPAAQESVSSVPVSGGRGGTRTSAPLVMAAAAMVLVMAVAVGAVALTRSGGGDGGVAVALAAADPAHAVSASAVVDVTPKGTKIVLDAGNLPPAEPGTYYHAWLASDHERVSAGTFHLRGGDSRVELWCGIDDPEFTTLAVTLESTGRPTGDTSAGRSVYVLVGEITP